MINASYDSHVFTHLPDLAAERLGGAVRQRDTGACERDLHDLLRELTRRMLHALVSGRDVARRRVVVGAEMRAGDAPVAGVHQSRQQRASVRIENDLRCFDHHLEGEGMVTETERSLEVSQHRDEILDLLGDRDLGERDDPS